MTTLADPADRTEVTTPTLPDPNDRIIVEQGYGPHFRA